MFFQEVSEFLGIEQRRQRREQRYWEQRLRWVEHLIKQAEEREKNRADK